MEMIEKLKVDKYEVEQSTTLIVQQLRNVNDNDVIELSKLPNTQREWLKNFALKELTEDIKANNFTQQEIEDSIKQIEERELEKIEINKPSRQLTLNL